MAFIDNAVQSVLGTRKMPTNSLFAYKNRFALVGTVSAGKSTTSAGIVLTTQLLRAMRPGF